MCPGLWLVLAQKFMSPSILEFLPVKLLPKRTGPGPLDQMTGINCLLCPCNLKNEQMSGSRMSLSSYCPVKTAPLDSPAWFCLVQPLERLGDQLTSSHHTIRALHQDSDRTLPADTPPLCPKESVDLLALISVCFCPCSLRKIQRYSIL